jgi:DNA-binding response OmpR family regulator
VSQHDDVAGPVEALLRRAGHRVATVDGATAAAELRGGSAPDVLILDRDLPADRHREIGARLAARLAATGARASFPLIVLGRTGRGDYPPAGWHEDACLVLGRPPEPGRLEGAVEALLRLAFYRPYRDLAHDLAQPVTAIHALVRTMAGVPPPDATAKTALDRLSREAERLLALMEECQRRRLPAPGRPAPPSSSRESSRAPSGKGRPGRR